MAELARLGGLWRRTWIAWPNGRRDDETYVEWVQGPSHFADLRQPPDRPSFAGVQSFADLTETHMIWLARQEGFAGKLRFDGMHFHWDRAFNYQGAAPPDVGGLHAHDGYMIEIGRDEPYVEHWARDSEAATSGAYRLRSEEGVTAYLVWAEPHFAFARDRDVPLPQPTLHASVAGADPATAQHLLDCEVSIGAVAAGAWRILRSSLPFREGATLAPTRLDSSRVKIGGQVWEIAEAEGAPLP